MTHPNPSNHVQQQYHQLWLRNGFAEIIPVIPQGAALHEHSKVAPEARGKCPGEFYGGAWDGMGSWPNYQADPIKAVRYDELGANVGLKMGFDWCALDVDMPDDLTAQAMWQRVHELGGGKYFIRVGQAPKFLVLFRIAPGETIRRKQYPLKRDDVTVRVEVMGITNTGRASQAVVAGTHPSGVQYQWNQQPVADLVPAATAEQMDTLVEEMMKVADSRGWTRGRATSPNTSNDGLSAHGAEPADPALVAPIVDLIPNEDCEYDEWVSIAYAIKNSVGDAGWPIFEAWSAKAPKNVPAKTKHVWDTFKSDGLSGFGKLVYWARHWNGGDLPGNLEGRVRGARDLAQAAAAGMPSAQDALAAMSHPMPQGVDVWADVEPLDLMQPVLPPRLPDDAIPPAIRPLVDAEAPAMGVPREIMFAASLGAVVAVLDDRLKIKPHAHRPWTEHPCLWLGLVGDPSVKKTPGLNVAMKPVRRVDRENNESDNARLAQWDTELKRHNTALKKYTDGKTEEPPEGMPPAHPETRSILLNDSTTAKLSDVLQFNPRGVTLIFDELSGWFASIDGRNGSGKERADYLMLYNGQPHKVARVSRGLVSVPNWSASIIGGIQPEALVSAMRNAADDGLLQRFYPFFASRAQQATNAETNPANLHMFNAVVSSLAKTKMGTVQLSPEAGQILQSCWDDVYALVGGGTLAGRVTSHLAKWEGGIYRWTLVMHAIECASFGMQPVDYLVSAHTAQIVADLHLKYFLPSVFTLYDDVLGGSGDSEHVRWIAGHILKNTLDEVGPRVIAQHYRAFRPLDDVAKRRVFRYLQDAGWITPRDTIWLSRKWDVNPRVHTLFAEQAVVERKRRQDIMNAIGKAGVDK